MLFIMPFLIVLLLFVTISIIAIQKFVVADINKNNMNLLQQVQQNVELSMHDMAQQSIFFDNNNKAILTIKSLLGENSMNLDKLNAYELITGFISAPANSKPYIDSVYIYIDNPNGQFFSSNVGLVSFDSVVDKSWFGSYKSKDKSVRSWTELRNVKKSSFDKTGTKILSIYQKLDNANGVIVLNILADYFNNTLVSLSSLSKQGIFIVNEQGDIIFSNKSDSNLFTDNQSQINTHASPIFTIDTKSGKYIGCQLISDEYKWKYISLIPQSTLYAMPSKLTKFALTAMIISFIFGFILIYYLTRRNYTQVANIISILSSAEKGLSLPLPPDKIKDEYGYIIHNILKTFIEQSYLKIQLSERKYKLEAMELLALQSQINPHFLFNTLETVSWECMKLMKRPFPEEIWPAKILEVHHTIENLSDILKYSLSNPNENVTLETEINNTKSYVEIQKYRYEDKFDVIWDCDSAAMNCTVMKLFLQPLIENSIYHGIKEKGEAGIIKIKIKRSNQNLKITIIDNGVGIRRRNLMDIRENMKAENEPHQHIGLYNTNKRIKLKYGEKYQIKINSKYNFGSAVYIQIPIHLE